MAKKDVLERCNKYLNDNLNMVESFDKLTEEFTFDIAILDQKHAKEIVEEYSDYVMMLRSTYRDYRFNVENFERYVLRLNSVISSSLIIEYRVNDILYGNVFLNNNQIEPKKRFLQQRIKQIEARIKEFENTQDLKQEFERLLEEAKEQLQNVKIQEKREKEILANTKKAYYFIGNISKDKELKELIVQICQIYIENELIRAIREDIFKKHKIVIENESKNKIHCLKMGAYGITGDKIAKVINLSLQNYGKNIIEEETLKLFNIFLNFKSVSSEKEYKEILSKYKKEAVKKLEATKPKYFKFGELIEDYTITILKELRWYINE